MEIVFASIIDDNRAVPSQTNTICLDTDLEAYRLAAGVSYVELALCLDLDPELVRLIALGHIRPTAAQLDLVLDAYPTVTALAQHRRRHTWLSCQRRSLGSHLVRCVQPSVVLLGV